MPAYATGFEGFSGVNPPIVPMLVEIAQFLQIFNKNGCGFMGVFLITAVYANRC